ncbi:MAG: hypothetical protein ACYDCK_14625 [Thermoplasmatota archaeon]
MRARDGARHPAAAILFAALLLAAIVESTLYAALPPTFGAFDKLASFAAGSLLASLLAFFVAPLVSSRAPHPITDPMRSAARLPALFALASLAALVALYHASLLDWSRLLKDWALSGERVPTLVELAAGAGPLAFVFVLHGIAERRRVAELVATKRVVAHEAAEVRAAFRRRAAVLLVGVVAAVAGLLLALNVVTNFEAFIPAIPGLTLVGPVLALGALALAATLRLRKTDSRE